MSYRLVVSEKPSVAMAYAKVLGATSRKDGHLEGNGYLVSWCVGHLVELAPPNAYGEQYVKWSIADLPILPQKWQYLVSASTKKQFGVLKDLMNRPDVDSIVCATDAGREGELIFRLVYQQTGCKKPFSRLWLSSMEDSAIREGFANLKPSTEYDALYQAALCRERADWMVGINCSRLFSCLYGQPLAVGRVMTPVLAMTVVREAAIAAFVPEKFYTVALSFTDGGTASSKRFSQKSDAETLLKNCRKEAHTTVQKVERKEKNEKPPLLYDLTTLQRDANRLLGYSAQQTLPYMAELLGTPGDYGRITAELSGVIFKDPAADPTDPEAGWQMADEYLSGDVRAKLRMAQFAAETNPEFSVNVEALTKAQPRELEASEIDVRLGATWLDPDIIQKFMTETFQIPYYLRHAVKVRYSPYTAEWRVEGKTATGRSDIISSETYGTSRANAYKILEETLNLKDVRIYDTIEDAEGKPKRVLNKRETMLAQQKQQVIKDAFANWVWQDPPRRIALIKQYNELFNSTRPREYDGSHIKFVGMNPEITLREHQRNAIAHVLYGGNTLLAHEVGAGKTYEMAASAMEAKRLGLCQKSLFVVPNHLTEQWASEFLNLYPNAKLLVARRKDFETANRKKFCARIATGRCLR